MICLPGNDFFWQPDLINNPHPIARQNINRDRHVSSSNREVIRHVIRKLRDGMETFRAMPKNALRQMMQNCIDVHRRNREEYEAVMFTSYKSE